jgi:hypothetical protein
MASRTKSQADGNGRIALCQAMAMVPSTFSQHGCSLFAQSILGLHVRDVAQTVEGAS